MPEPPYPCSRDRSSTGSGAEFRGFERDDETTTRRNETKRDERWFPLALCESAQHGGARRPPRPPYLRRNRPWGRCC